MTVVVPAQTDTVSDRDRGLLDLQNQILWLSMRMVYHANNVRKSPDGSKVGGHQSSSSSVVTILTYLYFEFMRAGDRISIKPHASPVYHVIQFLLGNLDARYLTTLRAYHGLQAYPSRRHDPDSVDFSAGSVGLGAVAPDFAALAREYASTHFDLGEESPPRYISLVGDAELDEGSVWEAIAEPCRTDMGNVLWVVDLNRQSLDRVIPGIRVKCWRQMYAANGWQVIDAKYGKKLQAAYALPKGELLRECIDEMSNEVYQRLLRLPPEAVREWLPRTSRYPDDLADLVSRWDDRELQDLLRNLGGHDFATLREAFAQADLSAGPTVIFAYTLKGWMLPTVGDPQNHSVILNDEQMEALRRQLGVEGGHDWLGFEPKGEAARIHEEARKRMKPAAEPREKTAGKPLPHEFNQPYRGSLSTQQIFGLVLTSISRNVPEVSDRVVTVSPDVASSTNLGGWINKVGVWTRTEKESLPQEEIIRALKWEESPRGQHIELGISENNLFMMLGQLGLTHEMVGELLFPIGTLYDPFIRRGLDALVYSLYSEARFIFVGTPSGVTLSPEGGGHQSVITPSIGAELPDTSFYEPCFGQELEWIMLSALEKIRLRTESTYLRLTSKQVDQDLLQLPSDPAARERLRLQALGGAYRLVNRAGEAGYRPGSNVVQIMASGAMVPEAVEASQLLRDEGVLANVINLTGPGPLYRRFQESVQGKGNGVPFLEDVVPPEERGVPVVTVVDGHPHSLAWIGSALGAPIVPLGVTAFGQSGSRDELYREYGIDVSTIMDASFRLLGF